MASTRSSPLWIGTLRHHFQADFAAMWGAGRLHREGRDPYFDPVLVDGVEFPRSQFPYGPVVSTLFRPLGRLDFVTARTVWSALQIAALIALLALGLGSLWWAVPAGAALLVLSPWLAFPLYAHLERGQIDLFVALGVFASLTLWLRGFDGLAGALLLAATVVKLPTGILFLAPIAALDGQVMLGALAAGVLAVGVALATDGPRRITQYVRVVLPAFDRAGHLPPAMYPYATPTAPLQRWDGRDFRIAEFVAGQASLARYVRARWGYAAGTVLAAAGLLVTLLAAVRALAVAPESGDVRTLAWLAAVTAMLLFQPLTWLMGCVHLIAVGMSLSVIHDAGGRWATTLIVGGLVVVGLGDVFAPYLPRRLAYNRPLVGLLLVWGVLIGLLGTLR